MNYFDGREMEISDGEIQRVRENFDADSDGAFFTGQSVEVQELYSATGSFRERKEHRYVGIEPKYAYPRPPTVDMAREMYLSGELNDMQFEQTLETALKIEGIDWGDPEALA